MEKLTIAARQKLRAQAHKLKPVVMIGEKGLTESVIKEIDQSLKAHELIKIKIATDDRDELKTAAEAICQQTNSEEIQLIGKILIIYRENPAAEKQTVAKTTSVKAKKQAAKRPSKAPATAKQPNTRNRKAN